MRSLLIFKSILVLSILPAASWSQSAMDILEKSIQMDHERKEGVSNYSVDQSTMNHRMLLYYEKIEGYAADGTPYSTFRLVPPAEIAERKDPNQKMSSDDLRLYADKVEESGAAVSDEMNKSGMPAGLLTAMGPPPGEEEWASPDPRVSSGAMADFLRAAATALENRSDGSADAAAEAQQMRQFANTARYVGTETIDGRSAFHLRADDLDYTPPVPEDQRDNPDGQEFVVNTVSLWIDTTQYVPLKLRMDGVVQAEGETRQMYIEKIDSDYQHFGSLYESTKQTMKMGGILNAKEMAEMKEAQAQLEEFDAQLAAMPAQQRQMMESMVGPQIQMLRDMVNGGGFVVENIVHDIKVDAGLPDPALMGLRAIQQTP
jgi:hypothetical protein